MNWIKRWAWGFVLRLRTDNNTQLRVLWLGILMFLVVGIALIGINPRQAPSYSQSESMQREYNVYFHSIAKTDAELNISKDSSSWTSSVGRWTRTKYWQMWVLFLIAGFLFIPYAFRDEVANAWRYAMRIMRESRGGVPKEGEGASTSTQTRNAPGSIPFGRLFGAEILGELLAKLFMAVMKSLRGNGGK